MKKVFAAILFISVLLCLLLLNPFIQKQALLFIAKRIEAKTGWQIEVKSFKFIPWYGFYLSEPAIYLNNRQIFTGKEIHITASFSFHKPYITIEEIYLAKPMVTIEKTEINRIIDSISRNKSEDKKSDISGITEFIHKIIVKRGSIAILHGGEIAFFTKEINISLLTQKGKDILLEKCSLTPEVPLIGKISCIGHININSDKITIRNLAVNYMYNFANIEGYINIRHPEAHFKGNIHITDITKVTPVLYIPEMDVIKKIDGNFCIKLEKNRVSIVLDTKGSNWGSFNSIAKLYLSSGKITKLTIKSYMNINTEYLSYNGFFKINGFWNSFNDFFVVINTKANNLRARVPVKSPSVKLISGKIILAPVYLEVPDLHIQTEYGQFNIKTLVSYENIRNIDQHIQVFADYQTEALINSEITLNSSAHLSASCTEKCTQKLSSWEGKGRFIANIQSAKVQLHGHIQQSSLNGSITIDNLPLRLLSKFRKSLSGLDGILSAQIKLNGSPKNPHAKVRGKLINLRYKSLTAGLINYFFEGPIFHKRENRIIMLDVQNLKAPQLRKNANITLKINQKQKDLHFNLKGSMDTNHYILCKGRILDFMKTPSILLEKAVIKWEDLGKYTATSRIRIDRNLIDINTFQITHRKGTIKVNGKLGKGKQSHISINVYGFPPKVILKKLADIEISEGSISGNADIKIINGTVTWKAEIKITQGSIKKRFSWKSILLVSSGDSEKVTARTTINSPVFSKPFRASISMPLKLNVKWFQKGGFYLPEIQFAIEKTETVEGEINVEKANLRYLRPFMPDSYDIKGQLSLKADIGGTPANPIIKGQGNIEKASVSLPDKKYNLTDINGSFLLLESIVKIQELTGRCMKGYFKLKGTLPIAKSLNGTEIELKLKDFEIPEIYGITGKTSGQGTLTVKGNVFSIKGKLVALRALLNLDKLNQQIKSSISDIEFVEDEENISVITEDKKSSLFKERFQIDVQIDLSKGNAWVRGIGVDTEVTGKLDIRKKPGKSLILFGEIKSKRGWYTFQNIRIKIVKGIVKFRGLNPPDPELIIVGEKQTKDINVILSLQGSISEPVLKLSSTPPMSEIDILSYLLFNRPARQLTARESINLQDQAALFLGSKATRILKELLGNTPFSPDVLDFRRDNSGSEIVEVGKYITPDFYVTYEKDVKNDRGDQISIEYRVNKHLSIQSQFGGENQGGVDILWRYDFGE